MMRRNPQRNQILELSDSDFKKPIHCIQGDKRQVWEIWQSTRNYKNVKSPTKNYNWKKIMNIFNRRVNIAEQRFSELEDMLEENI